MWSGGDASPPAPAACRIARRAADAEDQNMDGKKIVQDIRHAERCLKEARKALRDVNSEALLQRLSLVAQYAALAAHNMPEDQPGVQTLREAWSPASRACDESMKWR
jgi:hypothetical protein